MNGIIDAINQENLKSTIPQFNVGDTVKKGQVVAVVEAMKLENEIPSTIEGTVKEICVKVGDMVNNKDAIVILG